MNPDYRAAYQTVLENVVKLEEEIERLKASRDHLKKRREHATRRANDLYERVERLEAENLRLNNLLSGMFEQMDAFKVEWEEECEVFGKERG